MRFLHGKILWHILRMNVLLLLDWGKVDTL